ncbi:MULTISPECIES: PH domain-containing protein [Bacteroides]|uniref:PH domain-containing protein n=1 Tax=Bacteroides zhangwenhongii TaxID=2650157 RepID=A0ABT5HAV9_9BACE|nr:MULTISPECIES: PH domain-containing protein [Bacteroides]MCL1626955.1 PH domain-containing protein [Bacteroides caecicola]MDC7137450.1 PH domain-containing protein [Bacteroides zhangwenhongii]MDU7621310.1 PH domain-containing protein [Bacteroides stercoris]
MQNQKIYREISLRPKTTQFLVDELPLLTVCIISIIYGGMKDAPLAPVAILFAVLLSLYLTYRFIYLKRIRYHVGSEQLTAEQGVFQRSIGYIELYRVVDFHEHQTLLQQIFGLKTITVLSMDRTTPKLELIGLPKQNHIVNIIRERVEYNKQRKGIYEITNH